MPSGGPRPGSGRRPKPAALKKLEGNPGKRKIVDAPDPGDGAPGEPDWSALIPDGAESAQVREDAADEWRRIVPAWDRLKMLSGLDAATLADYCITVARILECERHLSAEGLVINEERETKAGETYTVRTRNPYSATVTAYRSQFRSYIAELGLSPAARARLTTAGAPNAPSEAAGPERLLS